MPVRSKCKLNSSNKCLVNPLTHQTPALQRYKPPGCHCHVAEFSMEPKPEPNLFTDKKSYALILQFSIPAMVTSLWGPVQDRAPLCNTPHVLHCNFHRIHRQYYRACTTSSTQDHPTRPQRLPFVFP